RTLTHHSTLCRFAAMYVSVLFVMLFFFFQAEDGIRDWSVTGVQTCALPISRRLRQGRRRLPSGWRMRGDNRLHKRSRLPLTPRQIGRASCRERTENFGGAGFVKKKEEC